MLTPWSPLPQTQNLQSSYHLQGYDFKDRTGMGGKNLFLCGWIISFIKQPFLRWENEGSEKWCGLGESKFKVKPIHGIWLYHPFSTYLDRRASPDKQLQESRQQWGTQCPAFQAAQVQATWPREEIGTTNGTWIVPALRGWGGEISRSRLTWASTTDSRPACLYQETLSGENWLH